MKDRAGKERSVRFRFVDEEGREHQLDDLEALVRAIRQGRVGAATLLFDAETGRWAPAETYDAYQAVGLSSDGEEETEEHASLSGQGEPDPSASNQVYESLAMGGRPLDAAEPGRAASAGSEKGKPTEQAPKAMAAPPTDNPSVFAFLSKREVQTISILLMALFGFLASGWDGMSAADSATRLGAAIGSIVVGFLFAGLLLVWSSRTRPYIPALGASLVGLATLGNWLTYQEDRAAVEQELETLDEIVDVVFDTAGAGVQADVFRRDTDESAQDLTGASLERRMLWAVRMTLQDIASETDSLARVFGIDGEPPADWLTARYLADAGQYSEVDTWLRNTGRFVDHQLANLIASYRTHLWARGRQARLSNALIEEIWRGSQTGVLRNIIDTDGAVPTLKRLAELGTELHELLVQVDARAHYDPSAKIARFSRDEERERVEQLLERVSRLALQVEERQGEAQGIASQMLDSLRRSIR